MCTARWEPLGSTPRSKTQPISPGKSGSARRTRQNEVLLARPTIENDVFKPRVSFRFRAPTFRSVCNSTLPVADLQSLGADLGTNGHDNPEHGSNSDSHDSDNDLDFPHRFFSANGHSLLGIDAAYGSSVISPHRAADTHGSPAVPAAPKNSVRAPDARICFSDGVTGHLYDKNARGPHASTFQFSDTTRGGPLARKHHGPNERPGPTPGTEKLLPQIRPIRPLQPAPRAQKPPPLKPRASSPPRRTPFGRQRGTILFVRRPRAGRVFLAGGFFCRVGP